MIKLAFFTNLDEAKPYVRRMNESASRDGAPWVGPVPRKGERIQFERQHRKGFFFDLAVVGVTYNETGSEARVELHMGQGPFNSILEWMEWFKRVERGE